ncbi:MAG: SAM-dependent methyltransferase [Methylomicrobium sp.]
MSKAAAAIPGYRGLAFLVALVSGASLAYEILLMRLFSIIQWHHFAYMIISLALLGYGISGVVLALNRDWLNARFEWIFPGCILLFNLAAPGCFWIGQRLPFNPAEIFWSPAQPLYLLMLYLLLSLPFFFAASAIGLALFRFSGQASSIYAADLAGAGLGCLVIISLLFMLPPDQVLIALALIGVVGLMPVLLTWKKSGWVLAACAVSLIFLWLTPSNWKTLHISPYKELRQFLRISGTRIIDSFSNPIAYTDVVESAVTPLRYAPGLSLNADREPPPQYAVFTDAGNMSALTRYNGDPATISYLDQMTSALPYHLNKPEQLLILGVGAGNDLLQAEWFGVPSIDAVELNGQLIDYIKTRHDAFTGGIFTNKRLRLHIGEARGFVSGTRQHFDLIQIALMDAYGASSAGLYALSENYLYTVEALQEYLRHLKPGGYLALTRWAKMPPRDALKLFATASDALELSGIADPGRQMLLIRGWQTTTLLAKNGEITLGDIKALKTFCADRSFDIDYYPGISEAETNRFNQLPESYYYQGATRILGAEREAYLERYKFAIEPATDDRPYFFQFFKWSTLPEILSLYGQGGISLLESGYIILVAGVLQALLAAAAFIGLPMWLCRRRLGLPDYSTRLWRIIGYFFLLGNAFLFIEIAFIQKFILFLYHPVYSVSVVLCSFLIAASFGSAASGWLGNKRYGQFVPIAGIAVLALFYILFFKNLTGVFLDQPVAAKFAVAVLLILPLGFMMGMPFPLGLQRVSLLTPGLIPWAWGINGFASVISANLATLIAIHYGFNAVILIAVGLYLIAALSLPVIVPEN